MPSGDGLLNYVDDSVLYVDGLLNYVDDSGSAGGQACKVNR